MGTGGGFACLPQPGHGLPPPAASFAPRKELAVRQGCPCSSGGPVPASPAPGTSLSLGWAEPWLPRLSQDDRKRQLSPAGL